jgi:hypothetical protein
MERGGRCFACGRGGRTSLVTVGGLRYGKRRTSARRNALGTFFEVVLGCRVGLEREGCGGPLP